MKIFDVAIVGSGPAGLMSAIFAAQRGRSVMVLEKNDKIGRKILATGNGRCNITNRNIDIKRYHGGNREFIETVLSAFDQDKTIKYFESLGILLKEEDRGRIFPRTNQAQTVVDALRHELVINNVTVNTLSEVQSIEQKEVWNIVLTKGKIIHAKKLILATGGKAAHQFGSSGDGIFFAKKLGHTVIPIHAALCPIETKETWVKEAQGLKIEAKLTTIADGKIIAESLGDTLFTHFGISGPAPMSLSRVISPILSQSEVETMIDMFPDTNIIDLDSKIEEIFRTAGKKSVKGALSGVVSSSLIPVILKILSIDGEKKAAEISAKTRGDISSMLKGLKLTVNGIRPLKEAQVTSGGINLSEIEPKTLESKIIKNLYFAGEIMDVDGDSGGFNLQWAWSSGYVVGSNV